MSTNENVREHYSRYPYPHYPWFSMGRWKDLETVNVQKWGAAHPVQDLWIAGCGTIAPGMFGRKNPNVKVLATDFSEASLRHAKIRAWMLGLKNITFECRDIMHSKYISEFDAIDCYGVLHHLEDPEAGLRILAKALRVGGVLRLMLYDRSARAPYEKIRFQLRAENISDPHSAYDFLDSDLRKLPEFHTGVGVADAVLHPLVHTFTAQEIVDLVSKVPSLQLRNLMSSGNHVASLAKI